MTVSSREKSKFPLKLNQISCPGNRVVKAPLNAKDKLPGVGLDSTDVRLKMVLRLQAAGLQEPRVIKAMSLVPRHQFIDSGLISQAYEDTSLPIGYGQTISKPSVVARMLELLLAGHSARQRGHLGRTLEVGTGCGYQVALLSILAESVFSIERLKSLYEKARELLAPVRTHNTRLIYGDGILGHAPNAPYDSIIACASSDTLPPAWLNQLALGGRLVAPLLDPSTLHKPRQVLAVVDRCNEGLSQSFHESVRFVPLKSGTL